MSIIMQSDDEIIDFIKKDKFNKFKPNKKKLNDCYKIISNSNNYDASLKIASHWEKFKSKELTIKNNLSEIIVRHKLKFIKQKLSSKIYNKKFAPITINELSKLKRLKVKNKVDLYNGLKKTYNWFEKNYKNCRK